MIYSSIKVANQKPFQHPVTFKLSQAETWSTDIKCQPHIKVLDWRIKSYQQTVDKNWQRNLTWHIQGTPATPSLNTGWMLKWYVAQWTSPLHRHFWCDAFHLMIAVAWRSLDILPPPKKWLVSKQKQHSLSTLVPKAICDLKPKKKDT